MSAPARRAPRSRSKPCPGARLERWPIDRRPRARPCGAPASPRVSPAALALSTCLPLRSTVTRSAISNTSSRRCETNRISSPRCLSFATMPNRRLRSRSRQRLRWARPRSGCAPRPTTRARSRPAGGSRRSTSRRRSTDAAAGRTRSSSALGVRAQRAPIEQAPARARLATQPDVLGHRQLGSTVNSWYIGAHAGGTCLRRAKRSCTVCPSMRISPALGR